jgi:hypothetical protein
VPTPMTVPATSPDFRVFYNRGRARLFSALDRLAPSSESEAPDPETEDEPEAEPEPKRWKLMRPDSWYPFTGLA